MPSELPALAVPEPAVQPSRGARTSATLGELYRALWRFADGARVQYVAAMSMLGLSSVVKLAVPVLAGLAINAIQLGDGGSARHAGWLILAILGVNVLVWLLHGPGRVLERNVGVRVRASYADALYARLASLPLEWHEKHHSGETQHRTQQATTALYDFTQSQFVYLQSAINLIGPLVALAMISPTIGASALTGYVVLGAVIIGFDRAIMRLQAEENAAERRYVAGLLDLLGNISTVLSLRVANASRRLLSARLSRVFAPLKRSIMLNEGKWCAVDLLGIALCWGLVALYAFQAHVAAAQSGGALLLGSLFMVYQYAQQAAGVIGSLASNFQAFARIKTNVASADAIWDAEPRAASTVQVDPQWRHIELRGIGYRYAGHERGGVHDVLLSLSRGERVALIGPSGSGKSTLLRLIAGLYEPQHGYCSVDGETLFGARHLGSVATLIPQEAEVFEASIRENLGFGADVDDAALAHAAQLSLFDRVLADLPQGLDTPISERGFNLSGGQRQRLALTRGLVAALHSGPASSIVLLDEPTSALDQATEARVFRRLRERLPDTCIVASVHRLSVLEHFDKVVLMADGAVVDCGTPDALFERQPLFRDLLRQSDEDETQAAQASA